MRARAITPEALVVQAADGYTRRGFVWRHRDVQCARPVVIINAATAVRCRYDARFAASLCRCGFDAIADDARGIGASRPATWRGGEASWVRWGRLECEAMLRDAAQSFRGQPLDVVAHRIGGFVCGCAPSNHRRQRRCPMGAQIAAGRDHPRGQRWKRVVQWPVVRPRLTALRGSFPGRRLGWVEDTPPGVGRDGRRVGSRARQDAARDARRAPFAGVTASPVAVSVTDDEVGTRPALARTLSSCPNSAAIHLRMAPDAIGQPALGPCGCFHDRFAEALWPIAFEWFQHARLPPGAPGVIVASRARRVVPAGAPGTVAEGGG